LIAFVPQAERTAYNFARRQSRHGDEMFVEESKAEARFLASLLFLEHMESIAEKDDPAKFMRMYIGYKLKDYWAKRATSTESYLRKHGKSDVHIPFKNEMAVVEVSDIDICTCREHVARNEVEERILSLYETGRTKPEIASEMNLHIKNVKKILAKIKKRLMKYKDC
jgi:DNA-directed RNA polymerase specialized sigma24 family protein